MTGAIKSTPVKDLESITGIQPLNDGRDMKILCRMLNSKDLQITQRIKEWVNQYADALREIASSIKPKS